jgi:glycosyltransferase involved in cell wall biosynthesis
MSDEQSPFFSIIIPTHNRAGYILNTLQTVLDQGFTDYEIIVVDDCSTDNTVELLQPLVTNEKIKLIINDKNQERSYSRNRGFEIANGRYATLLDSDDFMYPSNLQDAYDFIQSNERFHLIHNYSEIIDIHKTLVYRCKYPKNNNWKLAICRGNFLSCIGVFMHRDIYRNYTFDTDPRLTGSEDWEFWIRLLSKYDLGVIQKVNSAMLQHDNRSIKHLSIESVLVRKKYILDKISNDPNLKGIYKNHMRDLNSSSLIFAGSMCNSFHLFDSTLKYLWMAFRSDLKVVFQLKFLRVLQIALFRMEKH